MDEHDGYNPGQMPRRESEHTGARSEPTAATRTIDTSLGIQPAQRARRGERVALWVDVIKADKREEWERLIHDVLAPAVLRKDGEVLRRIRLLEPRRANDDGSWTYMIVPDPYVEGVEYEVRPYIEEALGAGEADAFQRSWDECHVMPQYEYDELESAW